MVEQLFGTDGVRGKANTFPMDAPTAMAIGRAIAIAIKNSNLKQMVVIGQDTRISGDMLASAGAAGICSIGVDVTMLGIVPTPGIAYLTRSLDASAGVVISASHNPYMDNGIKVFNAEGLKLSDREQSRIELEIKNPTMPVIEDSHIGQIHSKTDSGSTYVDFLLQKHRHLAIEGMKIVLDCANGATYQCAPRLFKSLGAKTIDLFCEPNGTNINKVCGSQHPERLSEVVLESKADLGLAFDGDGDRLIAVDEKGNILSGDQIMAICAKDMIAKGTLRNKKMVATVMSNIGLHQAMKEMGVELITTQVGDRYVMEGMLAEDAVLGGEDSGHMIFRDFHSTGDGMLAGLRLLDAMTSANQPLSQLSNIMTVFSPVDDQCRCERKTRFGRYSANRLRDCKGGTGIR